MYGRDLAGPCLALAFGANLEGLFVVGIPSLVSTFTQWKIPARARAQNQPKTMPSYDYDAAVTSIVQHRREAYATDAADESIRLDHLNRSVELFTNLSAQCPMTPLLWMQYAEDAAAVVCGLLSAEAGDEARISSEAEPQIADTRLNILELAIEEWPGCALLRLRHLEAVMAAAAAKAKIDNGGVDDSSTAVRKAFHDAISFVGRGSHRNEDGIVAAIYRLHVQYLMSLATASSEDKEASMKSIVEEIGASYLFRAECPMKEENDTLSNEISSTKATVEGVLSSGDDMAKIDEARIQASRALGSFANLEDEVDMAMANDYIMLPANALNGEADDSSVVDWNALLNGREAIEGTVRYLMGYGAANTTAAFAKYAGALSNRARKAGSAANSRAANGNKSAEAEDQDGVDEEAKDEIEMFNSLAISVYERGLSECPTVESLWVSYVQQLACLVDQDRKASEGKTIGQTRYVALLKSACARSVRNCPYSARLFGTKMNSFAILAQVGATVFDPDQLSAVAKEAIDGGFIITPEGQLEVQLNAIRHVNRRILALSCTASPEEGGAPPKSYDDLEPMDKSGKKKKRKQDGAVVEITEYADLDAETEQEISDLIDDVREMYDATDSFLKKSHSSWTEGKAVLWLDRARAEASIYLPLLRSIGDGDNEEDGDQIGGNNKATDQAVRCYEKSVKAHQPPHPDQWSAYIRYVLGRHRFLGQEEEGMLDPIGANAAKFRKVRGLFHRATSLVRSKWGETQDDDAQNGQSSFVCFGLRDYGSALSNLCHEFLDFERAFGSDESFHQASKIVTGKLRSLGINQSEATSSAQNGGATNEASDMEIDTAQSGKRKAEELDEANDTGPVEPSSKKARSEEPSSPTLADTAESNDADKKTNLRIEKKRPEHTVVVGKLEYPAHPFTVNVSNLSTETEDMDLVDAFARCGAIVHARILREKHHGPRHIKAKSKGVGLIQFEERESVEKALALDDEIGLHEKLIKVRRSHMPAAAKVPPGMHRTNPKGEGKSSKRNQKRREAKVGDSAANIGGTTAGGGAAKAGESAAKPKPVAAVSSSSGSSLAFIPRGLHGKKHHKVKVDLDKK